MHLFARVCQKRSSNIGPGVLKKSALRGRAELLLPPRTPPNTAAAALGPRPRLLKGGPRSRSTRRASTIPRSTSCRANDQEATSRTSACPQIPARPDPTEVCNKLRHTPSTRRPTSITESRQARVSSWGVPSRNRSDMAAEDIGRMLRAAPSAQSMRNIDLEQNWSIARDMCDWCTGLRQGKR